MGRRGRGEILQDFHRKMGKLTFEKASVTLQRQLLAQLAISVAEGKRNPMDAIDVAHRDVV